VLLAVERLSDSGTGVEDVAGSISDYFGSLGAANGVAKLAFGGSRFADALAGVSGSGGASSRRQLGLQAAAFGRMAVRHVNCDIVTA
jgi:hypothetical protein